MVVTLSLLVEFTSTVSPGEEGAFPVVVPDDFLVVFLDDLESLKVLY